MVHSRILHALGYVPRLYSLCTRLRARRGACGRGMARCRPRACALGPLAVARWGAGCAPGCRGALWKTSRANHAYPSLKGSGSVSFPAVTRSENFDVFATFPAMSWPIRHSSQHN